MRAIFLVLISLSGIASCDNAIPIVDSEETTILMADSTVLGPSPMRISSDKKAKAVGGETSVCAVLGKDVMDGDTEDRQEVYEAILGDAYIFGTFHMADGSAVELVNGSYSWSREGELVAKGELASCLRPKPDDKIPVGAEIEWVELGASEQINVLGVFVYSTNKWDF